MSLSLESSFIPHTYIIHLCAQSARVFCYPSSYPMLCHLLLLKECRHCCCCCFNQTDRGLSPPSFISSSSHYIDDCRYGNLFTRKYLCGRSRCAVHKLYGSRIGFIPSFFFLWKKRRRLVSWSVLGPSTTTTTPRTLI